MTFVIFVQIVVKFAELYFLCNFSSFWSYYFMTFDPAIEAHVKAVICLFLANQWSWRSGSFCTGTSMGPQKFANMVVGSGDMSD